MKALILAAGFGTRLEKGFLELSDKESVSSYVWDSNQNRIKHKGLIVINGKSLIDEPFEKRSKLLRKLIKPHKYKFRYSKQLITSDLSKATNFYKDALKDDQEGIMIKNLKSTYKPGARVGNWLKFKPDENELDLVITGAEFGKGKRVGTFSSFILS